MAEYVAGLDIGTTKIACIIAEKDNDGQMKIMGVGVAPSTGLRKGVVVAIEKTVKGIKDAVHEAERMAGYDIDSVYVGIAGEHIRSYNKNGAVAVTSSTGEITQDEVNRVLESASAIPTLNEREILHVVPQSYVVDDQIGIKDPIGMSGSRLEANVHIITGAVTSAQNLYKSVEMAGFKVNDLVLEPYASCFSVLENDEKEVGVALVDMGGGTTDIAIYSEDGLMQTFVVGIGGEYVTKDIAMGIRTPLIKAEEIKKKYGCADEAQVPDDEMFPTPGVAGREERQVHRRMLATIIGPRVEEILTLAARKIDESGCRDLLGAGVVLTGGGSELEGMESVAGRIFRLPIKLGKPQDFGGLVDVAKSPRHATGVGLCLYGFENGPLDGSDSKGPGLDMGNFMDRVKSWFNKHF